MGTNAKIARQAHRLVLVARCATRRAELKARAIDPGLSPDERAEARQALQALPRNSSPVRLKNRCAVTGRPRAFLRKFQLSRLVFRERALNGEIPGVTKSSW
jgi:small subunit ribosomal protein S14